MIDLAVPPANTPEWQEWRRSGLGASDLPAIVGCDPWTTEYGLWLEKRGEGEPREETASTWWGHEVERIGIEWYREMSGLEVLTGETHRNMAWPHLWASLDGRAGNVGIEVKYTGQWTEPPRRVEAQAHGQIGIADLARVDVVVLAPRRFPVVHRIERDEHISTPLLALAERWWQRYMLGDETPPLDGSRAAMRALEKLRGEAEMQATPEQAALMADLRRIRKAAGDIEDADRRIVNELKASMAAHGTLVGDGFRASWIGVKGRTTTNWEAIAQGLRQYVRPAEWDTLVDLQTTVGEPGSQFRPKWDDDKEGE